MYVVLSVVQVLVAVSLIVLILLQGGEGADIGAVFGGGSSQTVFGGRGPATFLAKGTIVLAALFLFTSIALTVVASRRTTSSVISVTVPARSVPAAPAPTQRPGGARG